MKIIGGMSGRYNKKGDRAVEWMQTKITSIQQGKPLTKEAGLVILATDFMSQEF